MKLIAVYKTEFDRRILQTFGILKADDTRAVVAKTLHLKVLIVYKAEFDRRILQPFGILSKVCPSSA